MFTGESPDMHAQEAARFGESVGLVGQFGNTRSGQWGARIGCPRSPGESGVDI